MSMKSSFSMKLFSKAARVIKGDHTLVFLAKQPPSSHKDMTVTDQRCHSSSITGMATAYLPLGNKTCTSSALLGDCLRGAD